MVFWFDYMLTGSPIVFQKMINTQADITKMEGGRAMGITVSTQITFTLLSGAYAFPTPTQ